MSGVHIDLECLRCKKDYTDPRTLKCFHTFCLKCLLDQCSKSAEGFALCPYPRCDETTKYSVKDLESLICHPIVSFKLEENKKKKFHQKGTTGGASSVAATTPEANVFGGASSVAATTTEANTSRVRAGDEIRYEKDAKEVSDAYNSGGSDAAIRVLTEKMNAWRDEQLLFAVIGQSGVGKSSYINAARNMDEEDESHDQYAKVGNLQTTLTCTRYEHPSNEHMAFYDVPGVGTKEFPKDTYLKDIKIDRYDAFLILSACRFYELDGWLAKELHAKGKKFYFVRTKIDQDVSSVTRLKRGEEETLKRIEETLKSIRNNLKQNLEEIGLSDTPVFLIDNYQTSQFDFLELEKCIADDLPDLKREVLVLTLEAVSKTAIDLKVAELRSRAWKMAILSGSIAAIPVPGLSIAVDFGILLAEANFYLHQFGLDDASLRKTAKNSSADADYVMNMVREEIPAEIGVQYIKAILLAGTMLIGEVVEELARVIPIAGQLIAAPISLAATKYCLDNLITKMSQMSLRVLVERSNSEV